MDIIPSDIKLKGYRVCADYLGGSWLNVNPDEIIMEKVTGGYANLTLKISLPSNYKPKYGEPTQIIMKIHLDIMKKGYFKQMTENIIAITLAEKKLFPKIYAIFDGGRLDEYVKSRPLVIEDFHNPYIIGAVARKLAHLHSVTIPIKKDPNEKYNNCQIYLDKALNLSKIKINNLKKEAIFEKFITLNLKKDLKWLRDMIVNLQSPVVYCHGDLQINNILLQEDSPDDPIYIIDLDASGYNYRGNDFGNLMNMFSIITPYPDPPYVKCDMNLFPSLKEKLFIFDCYLDEYQKINNIILDVEKEKESLLKEMKVFSLFELLWVIAFLVQRDDDDESKALTNKLDWLGFCDIAMDLYKELKNKFISEN